MSLVTQCPACTTLFRVVPDQLRVSDGWVRCGQCDEVFDANAHLQSVLHPALVPATAVNEAPVDTTPIEQPTIVGGVSPSDDIEAGAETGAVQQFVETPLFDKNPSELTEFTPAAGSDAESQAEADQSVVEPLPTFMHINTPKPTRPHPVVWWGLSSVLLLSLGAQWMLHERDTLAAIIPALKPSLESVCGVLGCQLAALRRIESVVIESSSFVKEQDDIYRLNLTLKNNSEFELMAPGLELTLTNTQDQALLRRIIHPDDLGWHTGTILPQAELAASLPVRVNLQKKSDQFAGYQLLAFYP